MQAQPTHHIERYPEHDVTEKHLHEHDQSPQQTNRRNMSLASFSQAFSKALPSYESVQDTTPVQISHPPSPVSETLYSDKSTNVSPDNTIATSQSVQVS